MPIYFEIVRQHSLTTKWDINVLGKKGIMILQISNKNILNKTRTWSNNNKKRILTAGIEQK